MRNYSAVFRRVTGLLIVLTALTAAAFAQTDSADAPKIDAANNSGAAAQLEPVADRKNEFGVWAAFAPDIPRVFGGSRRSTFGEIGFQYARRIATTKNTAIKYTLDLIPLAIINYEQQRLIRVSPSSIIVNRNKMTAYAVSVTPVGFQANFRRRSRIQPFLTANAGMIVFNRAIPDDRSPLRPNQVGRRFNFTLAGGGGVEFDADRERSYRVGFKFHHISNASTGNINPGFDQNLFYVGYTFKKF